MAAERILHMQQGAQPDEPAIPPWLSDISGTTGQPRNRMQEPCSILTMNRHPSEPKCVSANRRRGSGYLPVIPAWHAHSTNRTRVKDNLAAVPRSTGFLETKVGLAGVRYQK
jgi:hypothetical protein